MIDRVRDSFLRLRWAKIGSTKISTTSLALVWHKPLTIRQILAEGGPSIIGTRTAGLPSFSARTVKSVLSAFKIKAMIYG
jgi:hypothetical protein